MFNHHKQAIETITNKLKQRDDILAIIVGGSVAHGYAQENSDIDLMLVLSEEDREKFISNGEVCYYETESTPYKDGYVDAKYISLSFIEKVIESGSEPARFAFKDAFVTYSKLEGMEQLVKRAAEYPVKNKEANTKKFIAQFEAWKWMHSEGIKRNNAYLIDFSTSNYVLFAGRLVLAHNETLYPFHKWFMKVLETVPNKPADLIPLINKVIESKTTENIEELHKCITNFTEWPALEKGWPAQFVVDSELNWMTGHVPVADL